jgi:hypothetical protein
MDKLLATIYPSTVKTHSTVGKKEIDDIQNVNERGWLNTRSLTAKFEHTAISSTGFGVDGYGRLYTDANLNKGKNEC